MIHSIAFLTYAVSDINAARQFYEDILGLKLTHEAGGEWFEYEIGDTAFAISAADAEHPAPVRGAVLAFEVSDLARLQNCRAPFARAEHLTTDGKRPAKGRKARRRESATEPIRVKTVIHGAFIRLDTKGSTNVCDMGITGNGDVLTDKRR